MISAVSPQQFRAAVGSDGWRVLFDGANAFYRTASMVAGAALAAAIGALDGMADIDAVVVLEREGVNVRLSWFAGLTDRHVALARQITAAAAAGGAEPDVSRLQVVQVAVDALSKPAVMAFWQAALDYRPIGDEDLVDPRGRGPNFWFQDMDAPRTQRNCIHVDLSLPRDGAAARVEAALAAGGRLISDNDAPLSWALADPEGNELDIATHSDLE